MYRHCLAGALGGLAQSSSHAEAVVRTFGVLVNCEDDAIHAHLARSAFGFLRQPTKERIQQVTMIHWNNDSSRAESICFALAIESDRFSELVDESQAREVLLQIEQLEDMSGQRHAIWNFVSNCIEHHPEMTVQVLVDRIKKLSAADSRSRPHARQRLPYHFDRVRTGPASGKLVRLILEHSMPLLASDETLESDQGGRLVAALVPRMDLHGEVLASIANEATQTTLLALARLFRAYDGSMVLELDGVVSLLLRRAAAHGDNCLKEIHSTLYLAAYSISGTSAYKSTDTHQSRRAKRAEEIADKHKDIDSQTASFFQEIAKAYEDQHSDLFSRWIDDD